MQCPGSAGLTITQQFIMAIHVTYLYFPCCILLNTYPQELTKIIEQALGAHSSALEHFQTGIRQDQVPTEHEFGGAVCRCEAID